jgi:hypothetical protein
MAERGGNRDLEHALRLDATRGHCGVGFVDLAKDALRGLVVARALVGEVQAARGAVYEAHAEARFEGSQGAADHRGGHAELARGGRQAARLDDLGKHQHAMNHVTHIFALDAKDICLAPLF